MEKLKIKKLTEDAIVPTRATTGSAGFDLYSADKYTITLEPKQTKKVRTGIAIELAQENLCAFIYARSGLATKFGITPANCVGVVDSDYRGEIIVFLTNNSEDSFEINFGDRIAQMVIAPVMLPEIEVVSQLSDTKRGESGFGSSGK